MDSIGARIRRLRKHLHVTQRKFGELLGVNGSYISELEADKKNPSDQLLLNICHTFSIRKAWIKHGEGEMADTNIVKYQNKLVRRSMNPMENPIIRDIVEMLTTGQLDINLRILRDFLLIKNQFKEPLINEITYLLINDDEAKLEALEHVSRALVPLRTSAEWKRLRERREALDAIARAERAQKIGHYNEAREDFLWAIWILNNYRQAGYFEEEYRNAIKEHEEFLGRDPEYTSWKDTLDKILAAVNRKPGISKKDLLEESIGQEYSSKEHFLATASVLNKIKVVRKGKSYHYYPIK